MHFRKIVKEKNTGMSPGQVQVVYSYTNECILN